MRLKILNYAWHIGHQYELHRLPHDFFLLTGERFRRWTFKSRPLRHNVRFHPAGEIGGGTSFDLAILHFDEEILEPSAAWPYPFRHLLEGLRIPIIAICHGPAPFRSDPAGTANGLVVIDETKRRAIVELVGERALVITNSYQAAREWRFSHSRTIWHGLDPDEYPQTTYERKVLTIINSLSRKPVYQGHDLYRQTTTALPCDYLGKDPGSEFRHVSAPRPPWSPWRLLCPPVAAMDLRRLRAGVLRRLPRPDCALLDLFEPHPPQPDAAQPPGGPFLRPGRRDHAAPRRGSMAGGRSHRVLRGRRPDAS